ncbi:MAG TPA: hypothetical protein VFP58_03435 [Candidatus Eisenbacteria bacterium]|nr:hypothetical protein [Candidatus Eisenbacteria bacterium]
MALRASSAAGLSTFTALAALTALTLSALLASPGVSLAGYPEQIASYPRDGDPRVPSDAELYFVFDEPTIQQGSFSVADLDSGGGVLLNLNAPRWSALGDTVFLKPSFPMTPGHRHGMIVNLIRTADSSATDLPIVLFTVNPPAPGSIVITNVVLEEPLPGAAFAAGDSVHVRAVVTGIGTGPFRAVFYLDGTAVAMEEGFMDNGRPVTITPQGPIPSRRIGERRLHVAIESPQQIASRPITFLCLPPPAGLDPRRGERPDTTATAPGTPDSTGTATGAATGATGATGVSDSTGAATPTTLADLTPPPAAPRALTLEGTYLALGKSRFRDEESAALAWTTLRARYRFSEKVNLEAHGTWRLRADDVENGTGSPEQARIRLGHDDDSIEWGDLAPALASEAPLLAAPVPRRASQGSWNSSLADLTAYVALDSRPRSAAGPFDTVRSDLYAGRLSREFGGDRLVISAFGGYAHDDPTAGTTSAGIGAGGGFLGGGGSFPGVAGADSVVRTQAMFGGSGRARFAGDWKLLAEAVTVQHRAIEGVEPGRSRTGVRGSVEGEVAGIAAKAEAFRHQPDMATSLNPYALSNRQGAGVDLARDVMKWRVFGGFRREEPETQRPETPDVRVDRWVFGAKLTLGKQSWVTPSFIRMDHKGDAQNLRESRVSGELVLQERRGGWTRARFDIGRYEDRFSRGFEREVTAASVVSTRKHEQRMTSTISFSMEKDDHKDIEVTDFTLQAALELRYEVIPGTFLVAPLVSWLDRELETFVRREERFTGRLQLTWVKVPGLGDNAISLEGRVDRLDLQDPIDDTTVEGSVELSIGQRFGPR